MPGEVRLKKASRLAGLLLIERAVGEQAMAVRDAICRRSCLAKLCPNVDATATRLQRVLFDFHYAFSLLAVVLHGSLNCLITDAPGGFSYLQINLDLLLPALAKLLQMAGDIRHIGGGANRTHFVFPVKNTAADKEKPQDKKSPVPRTGLFQFIWWGGRWDSNPRRQESQSWTLPTELRPPLKPCLASHRASP